MESIYGTDNQAERVRLYVQRSMYKRLGLEIKPARLKMVHLVVQTCRSLLRQLTPSEEREVLTYLLNHPDKTRTRSKRRVRSH